MDTSADVATWQLSTTCQEFFHPGSFTSCLPPLELQVKRRASGSIMIPFDAHEPVHKPMPVLTIIRTHKRINNRYKELFLILLTPFI